MFLKKPGEESPDNTKIKERVRLEWREKERKEKLHNESKKEWFKKKTKGNGQSW